MTTLKHLLLLLGCGLLVSCGIQIQLEEAIPAGVNLGRGARVAVYEASHAPGPMNRTASRELCRAFHHRIAEDGYYAAVLRGYGMSDAAIVLRDTHVCFSGKGEHASARLYTLVEVESGGRLLYNSREDEYLSRDCYNHYDFYEAARNIARRTMKQLTPHVATYCEYVDENEQNPALGQGARACAAGNWEQGRQLAKQALSVNPKEAEAYYLLGLIERHAQNYAVSDEMFRKAASLGDKSKYAEGIRGNADIRRNAEVFRQQMSYR